MKSDESSNGLKFKVSLIILFILLIVIFTLQNTEKVTVKLWFWDLTISRALLIVVSIASGVFLGMVVTSMRRIRRQKDEEPKVTGANDDEDRIVE